MFSHTLGRRTFKCYLMLAGVHVDTVGFFRRSSESMHNNFAIYCGLLMVHCRCYIGLECTILFSSETTQSVGCGPRRSVAHSWLLQQVSVTGSELTDRSCSFWRRTFLRWLCQHFYSETSFIKKYDWQSGHRISPQCFSKFYPTNCPLGISKVSSSILKKQADTDTKMMTNMMRKIISSPFWLQFDHNLL